MLCARSWSYVRTTNNNTTNLPLVSTFRQGRNQLRNNCIFASKERFAIHNLISTNFSNKLLIRRGFCESKLNTTPPNETEEIEEVVRPIVLTEQELEVVAYKEYREFEKNTLAWKRSVLRGYNRGITVAVLILALILIGILIALGSLKRKLSIIDIEDHFKQAKNWKLQPRSEEEYEIPRMGDRELIRLQEMDKNTIPFEDYSYIIETQLTTTQQIQKALLTMGLSSSFGFFWSYFRTSFLWFTYVKSLNKSPTETQLQIIKKYKDLAGKVAKQNAKKNAMVLALFTGIKSIWVLLTTNVQNEVDNKPLNYILKKKQLIGNELKERADASINSHLLLITSGKILDILGYTGMMIVTPFVIVPSIFAAFFAKYIIVSLNPSMTERVVRLEYDIYKKQRDTAKLCKNYVVFEENRLPHTRRGFSFLFENNTTTSPPDSDNIQLSNDDNNNNNDNMNDDQKQG